MMADMLDMLVSYEKTSFWTIYILSLYTTHMYVFLMIILTIDTLYTGEQQLKQNRLLNFLEST